MTSSETRSNKGNLIARGSLWMMTRNQPVTTFIGAGGKTTCLRSLTHEIESKGLQVVAATTTKVYPEEGMNPWKSLNPPPQQTGAWFWYTGIEDNSGKWIGPSITAVDKAIAEDMRYWVIEGDGARERMLKCWESYEPQIPKFTNCAVLVSDRGLWGHVLEEGMVHRSNKCNDLLGKVWDAASAWSYFLRSPVFAPQYGHMAWVILLNSPGKTKENQDVIDPREALDLLQDRLLRIKENMILQRPSHLRLAAGDAQEGDLYWFDLW